MESKFTVIHHQKQQSAVMTSQQFFPTEEQFCRVVLACWRADVAVQRMT